MDSSHITAVILVPSIVFMVVVAPVWVWLHYRSKGRAQAALTEAERDNLEALLLKSETMMERIDTLEAILDVQAPEWRKHDQ
tara:strand:- start:47 stop:292 length:246 start_codon:yes stop_codon:yes gene_type:complete